MKRARKRGRKSPIGCMGAYARAKTERRDRRKAKQVNFARRGNETPRQLEHREYANVTGDDPKPRKAFPWQGRGSVKCRRERRA